LGAGVPLVEDTLDNTHSLYNMLFYESSLTDYLLAPVFAEFVNKLQATLEKAADHSPKLEATPTPLSPPFNISPNEPGNTLFLSPQSLAGCGRTTPNLMPGAGNTTPIMTRGTLSPRPKYSQFTCVENALIGTNHTHNVNSSHQIFSRSVPSIVSAPYSMENSPFNPNSLLVNAANGYSVYSAHHNFYPVSAPSPVAPGIKLGAASLSLTPKSITSSKQNSVCDTGDATDISSPPKRACLDVVHSISD
jgi:hypothetical protein